MLFAFLLVAPFSTRFDLADQFDRVVYFVALLFAALAAVLLLAPSIQHRILFRQDQKAYLVSAGTSVEHRGADRARVRVDAGCRPRRALPVRRLGGRDRRAASRSSRIAVIWYVIPIHRRLHHHPVDDET